MNLKFIIIGGLAMYVAQFALSMVTGMVIHEAILDELYRQFPHLWRPELNQEPPDMAALMPRWLTVGLIIAFIHAALYAVLRPAFCGSAWQRGLKYGLVVATFVATAYAGISGVLAMPDTIWLWWTLDFYLMMAAGGIVLGIVAEKLSPVDASHN